MVTCCTGTLLLGKEVMKTSSPRENAGTFNGVDCVGSYRVNLRLILSSCGRLKSGPEEQDRSSL